MPFTVNGFGTSVCGSRGDVGWGSYDAMEWVVAFMMPIIPIKCVHTFDWDGVQYRALPIRWSGALMMRTFLHRWLWGFVVAGVILGVVAFVDRSGFNLILLLLALLLGCVAIAIGVILHVSDKRDKKIRLVLGAVTIGNCDPANFTEDTLRQMAGNPRVVYDTETYARAAEKLLAAGSYAQAMWAARLCVAVEDASEGETLTDAILRDPEVADAVERVRKDSRVWAELMLTDEERSSPEESRDDRIRRDEEDDDRPRRGDRGGREDERRRDDRVRRDEDDRPRRRVREDEDY